MKKIILNIILICLPFFLFSQQKDKNLIVDKNGNLINYRVTNRKSNCNIDLRFDKETKWISFYNEVLGEPLRNNVFLGAAKKISLETRIHKDSLKYYRYSIIQDDSTYLIDEAIPSKVKSKWNNKSDFPGYVTINLGELDISNKKITLQIYKLPQKIKLSTVVIYNKPILNPVILGAFLYSESFSTKKLSPSQVTNILNKKGTNNLFLISKTLKDSATIVADEKMNALDLVIKNTDFDFIYEVKILRYGDDYGEETVFLSNDWKDSRIRIGAEHFKKPGNYQVQISANVYRSMLKRDNIGWTIPAAFFSFKVVASDNKKFSTKQLVISGLLFSLIVGAITGGLAVYVKNKQIKEKVAAEAKHKEVAQLKLNSIRSQLNPHFLFNALAGIQNLMNKNEINLANRYLSKFARLTRNVLESRELVSLNEEKTLLDDYLQMEQLRFGFQYQIQISTELDSENIEIPAMLLQPFVENSVKHGIAEKALDGKIEVRFEKNEADLILKIIDNGKGFDEGKTYNGLGLALSKNRISLLNTIYKDTPFVLSVKSNSGGTTITITLTQWL
ncbi:MAG: sensor histidine kinase [Pedobacter sp.]|nr:MAG: sensor histidine kinase [Pedobacter sp.]